MNFEVMLLEYSFEYNFKEVKALQAILSSLVSR